MPIAVTCDRCGNEINVQGGLLFSPPDGNGFVRKYHICRDCFVAVSKELEPKEKPHAFKLR